MKNAIGNVGGPQGVFKIASQYGRLGTIVAKTGLFLNNDRKFLRANVLLPAKCISA